MSEMNPHDSMLNSKEVTGLAVLEDGTGRIVVHCFDASDEGFIDVVIPHVFPHAFVPYAFESLHEMKLWCSSLSFFNQQSDVENLISSACATPETCLILC